MIINKVSFFYKKKIREKESEQTNEKNKKNYNYIRNKYIYIRRI